MCFPSGGGDGGAAAAARADEAARAARITDGQARISDAFSKFDDSFFNNRAAAYTNFATPQLEDQYAKAQRELTYALSRSGLLRSTVAGERQADLATTYNTQKQNVIDTGLGYANTARSDVENARSEVTGQLNASADPSAASNQAISRASLLAANPTFNPLAGLFQNVSAGLATSAESLRNERASATPNRLGVQLFGGSRTNDSGRVVGGV